MARPAAAAAAGFGSNEQPCRSRVASTALRTAETLMVVYALYAVAALLSLSAIAVALGAARRASDLVYGASLIVTLILCVIALSCLFAPPNLPTVILPFGLPWLGAHFRIDALAAFFLVVVN